MSTLFIGGTADGQSLDIKVGQRRYLIPKLERIDPLFGMIFSTQYYYLRPFQLESGEVIMVYVLREMTTEAANARMLELSVEIE